MNQRDSFNTRLADEQADNVRLRAEVERLKTEQGEALADQRRALCAEHDKDLMELKRVRKVAAEEIERLTGELAAVRREIERQK